MTRAGRNAIRFAATSVTGIIHSSASGTWWIPLLVILGLWRHVRRHWPLTCEPTFWSVVFPLGMYSVATLTFGKAAHLAFMETLARFMLWVAVAAWALVAAAFLARLARHPEESASGHRRPPPAPRQPTARKRNCHDRRADH